jgi:hypothetical protein
MDMTVQVSKDKVVVCGVFQLGERAFSDDEFKASRRSGRQSTEYLCTSVRRAI